MKNVLILKPKTIGYTAFVYNGVSDLENLIKFVGKNPTVEMNNGKLTPTFKKTAIPEKSVVMVDTFSNVTSVMSIEKATENYDVVQEIEFSPEYANKIQVKEVKAKDPKATKK